jgi:ribosome-binding factor A
VHFYTRTSTHVDTRARARRIPTAGRIDTYFIVMFASPTALYPATLTSRVAVAASSSTSRSARSLAATSAAAPKKQRARTATVAMAHPRRVAKVQQQMRREISNMMQTDKNLRAMVSPEERMGVDHLLSVMATVADVEVSNDLQVVKVYVSILGDERGKKNAIAGLKRMEQYVRRKIGQKVSLRLTPEIRFIYDDSFERGQKVNALLDEIRRENREKTKKKYGDKAALMAVEDVIAERGDVEDEDEEDWGSDDDSIWDEMLDGVEDALNDFGDDDDDDDDDDEWESEDGIKIINV